jgi:hypothetical protein
VASITRNGARLRGHDPDLPDAWASELEVIEYLLVKEDSGFDQGRSAIVQFCHDHGHLKKKGFKVKKVVFGVEMRQRRRLLGPIPQSVWSWCALDDREEYCPRHPWKMDKRSGRIFTYAADCESPLCPKCARVRAEDDLIWACHTFVNHERIWYAAVPFDKGLLNRLSQRQHRISQDGGRSWTRRFDTGMVHIYSSSDLSGTLPPIAGVWLPTDDALVQLQTTTLRLPGPKQRRFSGTWKRPSKPRGKARTFDLGTPPRKLVEAAEIEAERSLKELHGLDRSDLTVEQVETVWLGLVEEALAAQWDLWLGDPVEKE